MGQQEKPIDGIIAALRAAPLDFAGDLDVVRERFERLGMRDLPGGAARGVHGEVGGVPIIDHIAESGARSGVVIFVHAGGYVAGSAASSAALATRTASAARRRVVSVDYRLAPEHPFPAARDDVLAVYRGLLSEYRPGEIALVGASAGAGIVLQALMALRDAGEAIPAAGVLFSPFADLTLGGASYVFNAPRDPSLTPDGLRAAAAAYAVATPTTLAPTPEALRGLPPLQVHAGSIEILLSDSLAIADAGAEADVHVELHVWPGMVHVFPTFAAHLIEGRDALRMAGAFVDRWVGA